MRGEIAAPRRRVLARERAEGGDIGREAFELRIDDRIGPIGRDDAALPPAAADFRVVPYLKISPDKEDPAKVARANKASPSVSFARRTSAA